MIHSTYDYDGVFKHMGVHTTEDEIDELADKLEEEIRRDIKIVLAQGADLETLDKQAHELEEKVKCLFNYTRYFV